MMEKERNRDKQRRFQERKRAEKEGREPDPSAAKRRPGRVPTIAGRGNRPTAHIQSVKYDASDFMSAPEFLDATAANIYEAQAESMADRGVLTIETQPALIRLACYLSVEWRLMGRLKTTTDELEFADLFKYIAMIGDKIDRLARTLELRVEHARKGLHSSQDAEPEDDGLIG